MNGKRIDKIIVGMAIIVMTVMVFSGGACQSQKPCDIEGYWMCNYKTYFFGTVDENGVGPWDRVNDRVKGTYKYTGTRLVMGVNTYDAMRGVVSQTVIDGKAELKKSMKDRLTKGDTLTVTDGDETWIFVCREPKAPGRKTFYN